jgi:hypothetical protein
MPEASRGYFKGARLRQTRVRTKLDEIPTCRYPIVSNRYQIPTFYYQQVRVTVCMSRYLQLTQLD